MGSRIFNSPQMFHHPFFSFFNLSTPKWLCVFLLAKNVLLVWNINLSNRHRLVLLFSFCAKQCRNKYSFSLQWKLLTPLWILLRHYTSQNLKCRASKISGPFEMCSSLFHLAFQCSVKLLLPGQYLLSAPLAALQLWARAQLCTKTTPISSRKTKATHAARDFYAVVIQQDDGKRWWRAFHINIPNWNSWSSATSQQKWHSPCWLTVLVSPAHLAPKNRHKSDSEEGACNDKILTHLPSHFSATQNR